MNIGFFSECYREFLYIYTSSFCIDSSIFSDVHWEKETSLYSLQNVYVYVVVARRGLEKHYMYLLKEPERKKRVSDSKRKGGGKNKRKIGRDTNDVTRFLSIAVWCLSLLTAIEKNANSISRIATEGVVRKNGTVYTPMNLVIPWTSEILVSWMKTGRQSYIACCDRLTICHHLGGVWWFCPRF